QVVKTRARETDLRRANAALVEKATSALGAVEANVAKNAAEPNPPLFAGTTTGISQQQRDEEKDGGDIGVVESLRRDNAALRRELGALSAGGGDASPVSPPFGGVDTRGFGWGVPGGDGGGGGRRGFFLPWLLASAGEGGVVAPRPGVAADAVVVDAVVNGSSGSGGSGVVLDDDAGEVDGAGNAEADSSNSNRSSSISSEIVRESSSAPSSKQTTTPPSTTGVSAAAAAAAAAAGIENDEERAFREAGVNRVVEGLRAENTRLRQRLRSAERASESGEDRANVEAERADALEAELGRVRDTVKGRVRALKAALEEAEEDADRAVAEKEGFMAQWEEDVDALRNQLGAERKAREEDRRDLESVIFDLEDEVDDLKERYRQRKKPVAKKKKRGETSSGDNEQRSREAGPSGTGLMGRSDAGNGSRRRRTERETEERSQERSKKISDEKDAAGQWRKAMTLLQYLD
ncbi:unnamed protein product, partial [Ectocarpus sp. 8 AP-2014]